MRPGNPGPKGKGGSDSRMETSEKSSSPLRGGPDQSLKLGRSVVELAPYRDTNQSVV